jgi:membrane protease YdiL (CAAX protease family)
MLDIPPAINPPASDDIRHSRLGLASFIISIAVGLVLFAVFVIAGVLSHGAAGREYPGQSIVGAIAILLLGSDVVAAGLGIAGICQPRVKKVFAILGTAFSLLTIVGSVVLMIIGLIYAHMNR